MRKPGEKGEAEGSGQQQPRRFALLQPQIREIAAKDFSEGRGDIEGEGSHRGCRVAEEEGFEPPVEFPLLRFSRPPPSTARPFLRRFQSSGWRAGGAMVNSARAGFTAGENDYPIVVRRKFRAIVLGFLAEGLVGPVHLYVDHEIFGEGLLRHYGDGHAGSLAGLDHPWRG